MNAKLQLMLHVLVIIQVVWVEAACGKRSRRKREHKHLHYEDCGELIYYFGSRWRRLSPDQEVMGEYRVKDTGISPHFSIVLTWGNVD
jgi:hypothetical protein